MEEYLVLLVENAVKRAKKMGWKRVSRTYNVKSLQATDAAKEELKRVGNLMKADLVFFELTPVEFDI